MVDYAGILPSKASNVKVLKRKTSVTLRLYDGGTYELFTEFWDITKFPEEPEPVKKGRIGLRHMSTRLFFYRNFKVEKL